MSSKTPRPLKRNWLSAAAVEPTVASPFVEHGSDKSSQDSHPQHLRYSTSVKKATSGGMDWCFSTSPVSSKLEPLPSSTCCSSERGHRLSTRVRRKRQEVEVSIESSRDDETESSDTGFGRLAEANSTSQLQSTSQLDASQAISSASELLAQVSGENSLEKAQAVRALSKVAKEDAIKKATLAAQLIAVAQRITLEANRAAKRRRVLHRKPSKLAASGYKLAGCRLSIYWDDDATFYKGQVVDGKEGEVKIMYDDEVSEWLSLEEQRFNLLLPRASSAGCTPALMAAVEALGGVVAGTGLAPPPSLFQEPTLTGEVAVGWRISLFCLASRSFQEARVVAFKPENGTHHLLYSDDEDEWVTLAEEQIHWLARDRARPAGSCQEAPSGSAAVGWRVAVYWKADQTFYPASVQAFDAATARHHLLYNDGDEEHLVLSSECLKWLQPPHPPATQDGKLRPAEGGELPKADEWPTKVARARSARGRRARKQVSWGRQPTGLTKPSGEDGVGLWRDPFPGKEIFLEGSQMVAITESADVSGRNQLESTGSSISPVNYADSNFLTPLPPQFPSSPLKSNALRSLGRASALNRLNCRLLPGSKSEPDLKSRLEPEGLQSATESEFLNDVLSPANSLPPCFPAFSDNLLDTSAIMLPCTSPALDEENCEFRTQFAEEDFKQEPEFLDSLLLEPNPLDAAGLGSWPQL